MSITANRFKRIRAALCHNTMTAKMSRAHNDANVLCLGARDLDFDQIQEIIKAWLDTPFEEGRHQRRLDLIQEILDI